MNIIKKNIVKPIEELAESSGLMLIDILVRGDSRNQVVEVYVDSEESVTVNDCAELSQKIYEYFDKTLMIQSKYRLDVSSPGVDRPLKFLGQFKQHLNRNFELKVLEGEEIKKMTGTLKNIEGDNLFFQSGNDLKKINFNNIRSAKVLISF